jgi:hypothetical protein
MQAGLLVLLKYAGTQRPPQASNNHHERTNTLPLRSKKDGLTQETLFIEKTHKLTDAKERLLWSSFPLNYPLTNSGRPIELLTFMSTGDLKSSLQTTDSPFPDTSHSSGTAQQTPTFGNI